MTRIFRDPRYARRLAAAEAAAAPHLMALGLSDGDEVAYTSFALPPEPPGPAALAALRTVPDGEVADLRLVLLRRVAESDHGTAGSTQGALRTRLTGRGIPDPHDLALELALCRFAMDLGFGVSLAWQRVPLLDPTLMELDRLSTDRVNPHDVDTELVGEAGRCADLLANDTLIMEASATDRRMALLRFLQRVGQGRLPSIAFDPGDPFGAAMRSIVETDEGLARGVGPLLPIAAQATSVLPDRKRRAAIEAAIGSLRDPGELNDTRDAVTRLLQRLLVAPLMPRGPGLVTLRPSNQRLARAALWMVPGLMPAWGSSLLGEVGVRMGTSGKRDNQARDAATASTSAALLGELGHDDAVAGLARMLARVRNKPVRKQVEKAVLVAAERAGVGADELVERSLPGFGLGADGGRSVPVERWEARVGLTEDGRVDVSWISPDGDVGVAPPADLRERAASEVAEVGQLAEDIRNALRDERQRLERLLPERHEWPVVRWRRRYLEHPVAGVLARRLIWRLSGDTAEQDGLPDRGGLIDARGRAIAEPGPEATVRLWHPVESSPQEVDAWRDRLVERRVTQPFKQAFRETYAPPWEGDALVERRFADRPLAYGQMRALMGARGWTAPLLGPHDQGDRSVAYHDYPGTGLRAELEHVPAGDPAPPGGAPDPDIERLDVEAFAEALAALSQAAVQPGEVAAGRVGFARSGSLRFSAATGAARSPVLLRDVPPRVFSEALRDVDLFTSVPDPMRSPTSSSEAEVSTTLRTRADAVRRIIRWQPYAQALSVVGLWLRVERGAEAWAISLATGVVLRLPDEEQVEVVTQDDVNADASNPLPFEDEVLARVLRAAEALLSGS